MNNVLQLAYMSGALAARQKLATAAGPIAPAVREHDAYSKDSRQSLWDEFDQEPYQTGEESGLGMPSAGGINKSAGMVAMLAQQATRKKKKPKIPKLNLIKKLANSGDDTSAHEDNYAQGGFDGDAADPNRFKRMSSAIRGAFNANDAYDQSYAAEPAITQPHGSKYAAGAGTGLSGISSGLPSSSTSMMGMSGAPKPPQAPQMPQAPKMPNPMKPLTNTDPRSDKPPGMNLQHSLQTNVSNADSQAGFGSPQRRMMGGSI
jgi:hypothetical protein